MDTGYLSRLTIAERGDIKALLKKEIRRLTRLNKEYKNCFTIPYYVLKRTNSRKGRLAKIYSKVEYLGVK